VNELANSFVRVPSRGAEKECSHGPSPPKFSENPLYDVPEPLNRAPILAAPRLNLLCSAEIGP
jgi:hypothetical protein